MGGADAETGEFPWQVRLEENGVSDRFCGGTLLSSDTVLTSATCLSNGVAASDFRVIVGDHDRSTSDGEQTIAVRQIIPHPDFVTTSAANNFGIVKLATPVTFSDRVAPICLPTATTNFDNVAATVTGWGFNTVAGSTTNILQKLDVRTRDNAQCSLTHPLNPVVAPTTSEICTLQSTGENFCNNDQGGPLITNEGRFNSIIGIAATSGCSENPARGDKYARVTSGLTWINQQISGNTCPRPT